MADENAIRVIRVFLASPSDLREERRAAKTAVDEINRTVARPAGFHVDLIGWEDTLSGAGRPQAIINEDLDTCQMFIGMLWGRWGTPPDDVGRFTSGFEEEFTLASEKNERTGGPRIAMFFKDVDPSQRADPGPELSRVLAFRKNVVDAKKLMFETFEHIHQFEAKVRVSVADYIHRLDRPVPRPQDAGTAMPGARDAEPSPDAAGRPTSDTTSEVSFLNDVARVISTDAAGLAPTQTARLRLLGVAARSSANDEETLGAHDANMLWLSRDAFRFSTREKAALADAGVEAAPNENEPLWIWLADCMARFPPWLGYTTTMGPPKRRIGAFRVIGILGASPVQDEAFAPSDVATTWFSPDVPAAVRNAALEYVGEWGDDAMLSLAETELARNDYSTRKTALEAIIAARGRRSARDAAEYAIDASFDSLGEGETSIVAAGMAELDSDRLLKALESRFAPIRVRAIELLAERRRLGEADLRRLFEDGTTTVRIAAVEAFERLVQELTDTEAEAVLNRKGEAKTLGLLALGFDAVAQDGLVARRRRRLTGLDQTALAEDGPNLIHLEERLAAMAATHFGGIAATLRADVDDRFEDFWKRHLSAISARFAPVEKPDALVSLVDRNKDFRIRALMRIALDALETRADPIDLPRVRRALDDDACDGAASDAAYLGRFGDWEDIARVGRLRTKTGGASSLLLGVGARPSGGAAAVLRLAGNRISDLLSAGLPADLLVGVLADLPNARFRSVNDAGVIALMRHEDDRVRKAVTLRALLSLTTRRVRGLLTAYSNPERSRFYNVVFWLDLVQAYSQPTYRTVAKRQIDRMQQA